MAKRILVTGCSGYLGGILLPRLLEQPLVSRVVGVDVSPARLSAHPKLQFVHADIRDAYLLRSIMADEAVDAVIHLAFCDAQRPEDVRARETNVHGTLVLLEAAAKCASVNNLIIAGSTAAYGARRGNPPLLEESQRLRALGLACAVHKRLIEEELAKALPQIRRSLQVSVLRLCMVVGPSEGPHGPVRRFRCLPFAVSALGRRNRLQFLSEDDAAEAFCRAVQAPELRGAFNVTPNDSIPFDEVCRILGQRRLPVPLTLIRLGLWAGRRLFSADIPAGVAGYLAYPVVASNKKAREALGFAAARGSREALLASAGCGVEAAQ